VQQEVLSAGLSAAYALLFTPRMYLSLDLLSNVPFPQGFVGWIAAFVICAPLWWAIFKLYWYRVLSASTTSGVGASDWVDPRGTQGQSDGQGSSGGGPISEGQLDLVLSQRQEALARDMGNGEMQASGINPMKAEGASSASEIGEDDVEVDLTAIGETTDVTIVETHIYST
jgi:hypothetical protein